MADLKLSFMRKLDKEQLVQAEKVAKRAIATGVDPALAVATAYQESRLRPSTPDSEKGAIGLMQVLPVTGKAYGYSEADLRDPEKNLDAGLKNLKEALAYTENSPKLASLYYHSGPTAIADLAADKPIGPKAKQYLLDLKSYGTFDAFNPNMQPPVEAEQAPSEAPAPDAPPESPAASLADMKPLTTEQDFIRENSAADLKRQEYGALGGLGGAAVAASPYVGRSAAGMAGNLARAFNEAKQPIPKAPTAPMGGLPAGGAPTPPPAPPSAPMGAPTGGLPQGQPVMGVADAGRMAQGQTGVIPYNTSKALGLTDIEAGQSLSNTKQEGGAWDLANKRAEAMNKVRSMGMGNFVENPRFGGIMTQAPSVGGGPRESFAMQTPEAGKPAQLAPIPKAPIIPTTPPPPPPLSGLDQVKNMFTGMMKQSMRLMPVVGPPLAGLSIGRDIADMESQMGRAPLERDYTDIGLSTAGALSTGASLYPPFLPVAAPLSIAIPTFRNIRRNVLAQESDPELQLRYKMPPTEEEKAEASRPFIGYAKP